ncbi:trigger factor [Acidicapsa dinghuensis]|uniref:Trigger factor n=1 Tax=Acidicapsa dinghuensis TaxID=2218256 RepID=A0ABW1EIY4_9BACT|nr:trigger factor [Acidicapsa dinghuensis]
MSSADTLENTSAAGLENTGEAHDHNHDHDHEGHDHAHDHDHSGHQHGPVLNPDCVREVKIEATAEEVDKAFSRVVREYKKYAKIPGFRPGKVPEQVVRRRFAEQIRKDVVESLLPERFRAAIEAAGVAPVSQPNLTNLTLEEGKALDGTAIFEVIPPFSIDGYQDVTVPKSAVETSGEAFEAGVQSELQQLRESRATIEPVEEDRAIVDGDWVQISYSGILQGEEGEPAPPITGQDSLVEISGSETLPAFTEALRGSKPGQELKVEVTYPDDYTEAKLAGKTVAYNLEVKAIKKRNLPVLDDEFAKELGDYENLAALETRIRENHTARKEREAEQQGREALFAALNEKFNFPIPESLVQQQVDARLERGLRALAQQGMSADMMRKLDFTRLRDAQRDSALSEVKTSLLLDRIADAENVTVSDEELDRELYMASLQSREPVETVRARLTEDGSLARIREQLRREKTASVLYQRLPAA